MALLAQRAGQSGNGPCPRPIPARQTINTATPFGIAAVGVGLVTSGFGLFNVPGIAMSISATLFRLTSRGAA
jgi:hypothetical protein